MKIAIIIPTYNEARAISNLIDEIFRVCISSRHECHVVVVDANSPDGTAAIAQVRAAKLGHVHLIVENSKDGIGAAYIKGIRYAVDGLRADVFVEFDGDGQHDPRDIPRLIAALDAGYDHVIGSRYVSGGSIPREWALYRKLLSRVGSLFARLLLELPIQDATSGLTATRLSHALMQVIPLDEKHLLSTGQYAYRIQFLHSITLSGASIREIPIAFRARETNISKSIWHDILESLRVIVILRARTLRHWRLLRVAMVGGIGIVIQATLLEIFGIRLRILPASLVVLLAGEIAIISNFVLNDALSFRDKRTEADILPVRFARFQFLALGSVVIQWVLVRAVEVWIGFNPLLVRAAYLTGVALGFFVTYAGAYFWVWSKTQRENEVATVEGLLPQPLNDK